MAYSFIFSSIIFRGVYLHEIHKKLEEILIREKRENLYKQCLEFLNTRVELDLASFKEDIWSH